MLRLFFQIYLLYILTPRVAIAILNWNGQPFLQQFLPSVVAGTYTNKEIIVIDNASTDNSITYLQEHYPSVRIIRNSSNLGFANGYNEGLKHVEADYFVLLNSDVEVTTGWIEPIINYMEQHPIVAAVQPKLLQFKNRDFFEYAGAAGGWIDSMGYPFSKGRVFEDCEKDEGQYNTPSPIFWATGAAFFIRAAAFREMKGFDGYFFAHMEEIDLCWRLQWAGYEIHSFPEVAVFHVGGGTLPKGNSRKVFLNFRNNLIMLSKNLPLSELIWKIPVRFGLDALSAVKTLISGDLGYFMAVAKAHFAYLGWLLNHRKEGLYPLRKNPKWQGYYSGWVIKDYFLKGRKKFAQIIAHKN